MARLSEAGTMADTNFPGGVQFHASGEGYGIGPCLSIVALCFSRSRDFAPDRPPLAARGGFSLLPCVAVL